MSAGRALFKKGQKVVVPYTDQSTGEVINYPAQVREFCWGQSTHL
jgi:hypothetical protein